MASPWHLTGPDRAIGYPDRDREAPLALRVKSRPSWQVLEASDHYRPLRSSYFLMTENDDAQAVDGARRRKPEDGSRSPPDSAGIRVAFALFFKMYSVLDSSWLWIPLAILLSGGLSPEAWVLKIDASGWLTGDTLARFRHYTVTDLNCPVSGHHPA